MVHTQPLRPEHLAHLPWLGGAAMSDAAHFRYLRTRHAEYPETAALGFLRRIRTRAVTPDTVVRVATADDADPFTDLSLGSDRLWMRGAWVQGVWMGEDAKVPDAERRVPEGRIVGYTIWTRTWPTDADAAAAARERAGIAWPTDSLGKKLERFLFSIMDRYAASATPDPARDAERTERFTKEVSRQYDAFVKPVTDEVKEETGWLYCVAVCVDPSFQRRGIGARMMRWGLERAEKEGAPILLIASAHGSTLYTKLGFECLGTIEVDNMTIDKAMVYWPKGFTHAEKATALVVERERLAEEEAVDSSQ